MLLYFLPVCILMSFVYPVTDSGYSLSAADLFSTDTASARLWIKVDTFDLTILPPSSGVRFYRDGIVFLSSSKFEEKTTGNHLSFGMPDTRYAGISNRAVENPKAFSSSSAFPFPSEAFTFSSDYSKMYFTKSSGRRGPEKIYMATYSGGTDGNGNWTADDDPVSFCTGNSIYTHPALSVDGKIMVFASDKPGSFGGMDLYATVEKGGVWSEPVNLGDAVNSSFNEMYPFLDADNNLYFSSDNIQGFGGYDVYVCKFKSNTWEKPINLSDPVNTVFDDVAFSISRKDGKSAFFTIKRDISGKKEMKLCRITMREDRPNDILTLSQFFTRPDITQMVILALEPAVQATDEAQPQVAEPTGGKDVVMYRVQFMTSFNPRTRSQITVDGKAYDVSEYLYSGAYRLCVGEFSTPAPAVDLQNLLMKNGYPQAFVLVFKNGVMSLDPELLRGLPAPVVDEDEEEEVVQPPVKEAGPPAEQVAEQKAVEENAAEVKKTEEIKPVQKEVVQKPEPQKPVVTPPPSEKKDVIVYRVQILSNSTSKGSYKINIANKQYDTFEYFYVGAYRTCVGEFNTLSEAASFQKVCRSSGHGQAFVVAFKNGTRSTDPALFK